MSCLFVLLLGIAYCSVDFPAGREAKVLSEGILTTPADRRPRDEPAPEEPSFEDGAAALPNEVLRCWNLGSLSAEALRTRVTIFMQMNRDGTPLTNSIRLIRSEGGSSAAASQAFEAGRRAIIRCGSDGFDLPEEKYEQWKEIEMTFDPEQMRSR
ncbi:hypothetical protein [Jannaschia formosa]|uniref:hypothetical protein n=1 Tax=Jannaschia formosa TaxID=2259592 RepID=UPI00107553FE|nr:hypothetical protein [Jannaschia formosa]TFL19149.1 hypothetical protein DR046_06975 [Jannaschia formosa]